MVLYHGNPLEPGTFLWRFLSLGYVSVSFFFMLSGFILAKVYFASGRPMRVGKFFISRLARIYPLYLVALLLDLPHYLWISHSVLRATWTHIAVAIALTALLAQAWFPRFGGLNDPSWSLSAEAFFYALFPLLGGMLWRLRNRAVAVCGFALFFAGLLLVRFAGSTVEQAINPALHLFVFLLGVLLAKFLHWLEEEESRRAALSKAAPFLFGVPFLVFLAIPAYKLPVPGPLLQHGVLAPLFAAAILALSSGNRLVERLFAHPWLVLLGEASYALYLIHVPLGFLVRKVVHVQGMNVGFFLYLGLSVMLSVLSFLYLEKPARRWVLAKTAVRSKETLLVSSMAQ